VIEFLVKESDPVRLKRNKALEIEREEKTT